MRGPDAAANAVPPIDSPRGALPLVPRANDDAARFCSSCGTALARMCPSCGAVAPARRGSAPSAAPPSAPTHPRPRAVEERRLLSILFADLAGFTQRSDHADPEDVRGILVPFHAIAKEEIERFGGMLDKFIGDAAMGVFGAPVAHEDDAERAVRAALSIRERVSRKGCPCGSRSTPARRSSRSARDPRSARHVAGDVVNTASRLQGLAPEGEVVVGETTERATRRVIDYEGCPPATSRGRPNRSRCGSPVRRPRSPSATKTTRRRSWVANANARPPRPAGTHGRDQRPHMVTVVGEPGLGKSRLVADLGEHVRAELEDSRSTAAVACRTARASPTRPSRRSCAP